MKAFDALKGRLKRPSASMIIATVALFVALGGGASRHGQRPQHRTAPESSKLAAQQSHAARTGG